MPTIYNIKIKKKMTTDLLLKDNYMTIKYIVNEKEIKVFGSEFVKNNKNICKIKHNNIIYPLKSKFIIKKKINNNSSHNLFVIKLMNANQIKDMSYMFYECSSLYDFSTINTIQVTNMSYMFYGCSSLSNLPNISHFNTSNVTDIAGMFKYCNNLKTLPDISNWDTNKIIDISHLFFC